MEKYEMGGACIRSGKIRNTLKNVGCKNEEGRQFIRVNLEINGRFLLKCIIKK
jgi:hypothetical protein